MRPSLVRVVQRKGWELELPDGSISHFESREVALDAAMAASPEWIEVGEIKPATDEVVQHHRWRTLQRDKDGSYRNSGLGWGGG